MRCPITDDASNPETLRVGEDFQVPNVVFFEGFAEKDGHSLLYYGDADKFVGVAEDSLK
jgi:predicted GH43/DUF377 family glycosyl hydrolase